jgi:hypothetical protein
MATTVELHPNIGSVWQRGLQLWDLYATGTYTNWAHSYNGSYDDRSWDITVTNPDESTDTFTLIAMDMPEGFTGALTYLSANPGFHATLTKVYPNPIADGSSPWAAYRNKVWNWRLDIWAKYTGALADLQNEDDTGTRYGITTRFIFISHFKNLAVVLDGSGILWGTPTVDVFVGYPTDFVGASPIAIGAAPSGGGSIDVTPIVEALNEIALIDVTYTVNNGKAAITVRGKVQSS